MFSNILRILVPVWCCSSKLPEEVSRFYQNAFLQFHLSATWVFNEKEHLNEYSVQHNYIFKVCCNFHWQLRPSKINNMLIVPALTDFWCLPNFFVTCYFYKKIKKTKKKEQLNHNIVNTCNVDVHCTLRGVLHLWVLFLKTLCIFLTK